MIVLKKARNENKLLRILNGMAKRFSFIIETECSCENNENPELDELKISHDVLIEEKSELTIENTELKATNLELDGELVTLENYVKEKDLQIKDLTKENKKLKKAE